MRKIDLSNIAGAAARLQALLSAADNKISSSGDQFLAVDKNFCKNARNELNNAKNELKGFGINVSISQIDSLIDLASMRRKPTYDAFSYRLNAILSVLYSELGMKSAFSVDGNDLNYVLPTDPIFGHSVEISFPSASFDIEEAATCYGLGRDTASVFHLMRAVETGLRAIAASLGLPDPTGSGRNWGQMSGAIKAECDHRSASGGWASSDDRTFYNEVYASIDSVRVAWRNTTMHVEKRYTHDEAEQILAVTKGFLKKLAERIDESGTLM